MSDRNRTYGASHGAWSRFKSTHGITISTDSTVVSQYIKQRQIARELKERLTESMIRSLFLLSHKAKEDVEANTEAEKKFSLNLEDLRNKVCSLSRKKLNEANKLLNEVSLYECLKFINNNKDLSNINS